MFSAALLLFAMSFGTTVRVIAWFGGSVLLYSRVGFGSSYFYSSALILYPFDRYAHCFPVTVA
jgi:hypothetical protein